ncbi:AAA family ATPase [Sporosarcina sp. Marseille-Q4063]|uniref:AAA family ATPase n=1 Tax=Sporosarcina sp. Marseille-Q4063 TaxID=2810514 RepID=UPI001BB037FA|nr:AAA family ATPase [Sporosarcina sp. Marseille-Q4063]QUW20477.1 AAA family ATPase [Sporosarcina sp. Marseille-Q4063]
MGENIIYYGPPGTGKTYLMQKLKNRYTGFSIQDSEIVDAYVRTSEEWVLLSLIILQGDNLMSSDTIQEKVDSLSIPTTRELRIGVSAILNSHSIELSSFFSPSEPQIFKEVDGKWHVDLNRLLSYEKKFYEKYLSSEGIEERFMFVTFHQSFAYEDFVEGIRPVVSSEEVEVGNGSIQYNIEPGVFKRICDIAKNNPHKEYAIFIDEINRGNISEIFGELITLIELDKRLGADNQLEVVLPYSKKRFGVPINLDIIGTMNSTDRSIALIDLALRRRFKFIKNTYDLTQLKNELVANGVDPFDIDGVNIIRMLDRINKRIEILLDSNFVIGHAYFIKVKNLKDVKDVLVNQVIPLLEEYFYDDLQKVQLVMNDLDEDGETKDNAIYKHIELEVDELFDYLGELDLENRKSFFINHSIDNSSLIKIYS